MLAIYFYLQFVDNKSKYHYLNMSILPDKVDTQNMMSNFKFLISRTIVKFLPAFKCLQKNVTKLIDHPFKNEMSKKSEVVSKQFFF